MRGILAKSWLIIVALLISAFMFGFDVVRVQGDSMEPTYCRNDVLVVQRKFLKVFGDRALDGHAVMIEAEGAPPSIKRILGVSGDTIKIKHGSVIRNGVVLDEPYVCPNGVDYFQEWPLSGPGVHMPSGRVFYMGDNRSASTDSRLLGATPMSNVRGRVVFTLKTADPRCGC